MDELGAVLAALIDGHRHECGFYLKDDGPFIGARGELFVNVWQSTAVVMTGCGLSIIGLN